uniref:RING-type domain-containing protein n=1 Tax=Chlamydomonas chlamydogama TaxID=225041 RepID=A0A7S2QTK4_9CHLO
MGELEELSGRIPQVQDLAESLTCHICYELFTGPVLLPCGHSFCSGCVRQNFDFKTNLNQPTVCPNCRAPTDPAHLKASVSLREAVRALKQLSPILKSLVQDAERGAACGNATLVEVPDAEDSTQPEPEAQAHARQQSKAPTAMQTARIRCVDPRAGPAQVVTSGAACLSSPDPIPVHGARSGHMDASVISASVSADEDDEPVSGSRGSGRGTSAAARDQLGGQQQGQERIDLCSSSDDEFQQQGGRQQRQAQGAGAQPATGSGRPLLRSRSRSSSVEVVPASAARGGGQAAQRDEASSEEGDDGGGEDDKDYEPDGERPAKRQRRSSSGRAASGSGAGTGEAGQEAPAAAAAAAGPSRSPRSGLVVPDGYVLCPVCSCTIRAAFCEHHVEACLQKQDRLQQQQQQGRTTEQPGQSKTTSSHWP